MNKSHIDEVRDKGEGDKGMKIVPAGPIDKQGSAEQIVAVHHFPEIITIVAPAGLVPEARD